MKSTSDETRTLLVMSLIKGVGKKTLFKLGIFNNAAHISFSEIKGYFSALNISIDSTAYNEASLKADQIISEAKANGHWIISYIDKAYPNSLRGVHDAPPILFVAGSLSALSEKSLTIIGTRNPTDHGEIIANNVTEHFSQQGWNIVSGLAKGVDTIAHQACINSGRPTVAVMAQSLDKVYPKENEALAIEIVEKGGALITEYPYGSPTFKSNFVDRDRIQAALGVSVILVQTGLKGGSLHASRAIINYGRPLIIIGQSKTDIEKGEACIQGNLALINGDSETRKKILNIKDNFDSKLIFELPGKRFYSEAENYLNEKAWWNNNSIHARKNDLLI